MRHPKKQRAALSAYGALLVLPALVFGWLYWQQLVDAGYNPGAICFFAGYHADVALIKLERVATVEPSLGAICFAAVVILTMFAAMSFDPRLIWDSWETEDER